LLARPRSAWRRIELAGVSRLYRTPRILDDQVTLADYHWYLHKSYLISGYRVKIGIKLHEVIVCRSDNAINRRKTLRKPHGDYH